MKCRIYKTVTGLWMAKLPDFGFSSGGYQSFHDYDSARKYVIDYIDQRNHTTSLSAMLGSEASVPGTLRRRRM